MKDIVIIGSGNVAEALASGLTKKGHSPLQIFSRNKASGKEIAFKYGCEYTNDPEKLAKADLYLLAVSDRAISSVSASLNFGDGVVAHTSGSTPVEALSGKIVNRGVFYPLQSFTKGREVDFTQVPVMIEGTTPKAKEILLEVASELSGNIMEVASDKRAAVHMAAVFASNFTNYMYTVGERLAKDAGMDFNVLKPLIAETAQKAVEADSPLLTQTGPASRNDFTTKAKHCEMLTEKPELKNLYISISNNIWETSKKISRK